MSTGSPLRFSFVLHIHQPVGNFDFVFQEHADDVYRPFLDFLDERELWPIGLHVSGPLLEWLGENDAELHDRIGRLASDGKAELLSAGWYEPILAALDHEDRSTQLGWMREELETRFGVTPRGSWLTERVWLPELAADLADAGIQYTLVDDHLARRAGATDAELLRPIRAEHEGRGVDVFAIDEGLRYLIPFKPAGEVAAELRRRQAASDPLAMFADDGEKFGGWPRTREWLYDKGWLEAFGNEMDALRSEGALRMVTPAVALDELGGGPTFELPVGSYSEMDEWAGGPWTGFLDRYSEAGRLHTWMSALSAECRAEGDPPELRRAVGRAQCNDAYWHGVFGGLYMKHLREGVRAWMVTAQRALGGSELSWEPAGARDGTAAHVVRSASLYARITGEAGGTLSELVWLDPQADVTDYLTRRLESYHVEAVERGARSAGHRDESEGPTDAPSIHDTEEEAILERLPPTDPATRVLVRDRVLGVGLSLEAYEEGLFDPVWSAAEAQLNEPARVDGAAGLLWSFDAGEGVTKTIRVAADRVEVEWSWDPARFPDDAWFAPELSLACAVELTMEPEPPGVWRYPIITTSKCPDGFEEIQQGGSVTPHWAAGAGSARLVLRPAPSGAS